MDFHSSGICSCVGTPLATLEAEARVWIEAVLEEPLAAAADADAIGASTDECGTSAPLQHLLLTRDAGAGGGRAGAASGRHGRQGGRLSP